MFYSRFIQTEDNFSCQIEIICKSGLIPLKYKYASYTCGFRKYFLLILDLK